MTAVKYHGGRNYKPTYNKQIKTDAIHIDYSRPYGSRFARGLGRSLRVRRAMIAAPVPVRAYSTPISSRVVRPRVAPIAIADRGAPWREDSQPPNNQPKTTQKTTQQNNPKTHPKETTHKPTHKKQPTNPLPYIFAYAVVCHVASLKTAHSWHMLDIYGRGVCPRLFSTHRPGYTVVCHIASLTMAHSWHIRDFPSSQIDIAYILALTMRRTVKARILHCIPYPRANHAACG